MCSTGESRVSRSSSKSMAETKDLLSQHKYKNNKSISLYLVNPDKLKIHEDDVLLLEFDHGGEKTGMHLRPDEAILLSKLINEAVFKAVKSYEVELLNEDETN